MSKYIPTDNKPKGQVKPKLKVKVAFNEEERILHFRSHADVSTRNQFDKKQGLVAPDAASKRILLRLCSKVSSEERSVQAALQNLKSIHLEKRRRRRRCSSILARSEGGVDRKEVPNNGLVAVSISKGMICVDR